MTQATKEIQPKPDALAFFREHPYFAAAALCLLTGVLTLGDQTYMGPGSVAVLLLLLGIGAYFALRERLPSSRRPLLVLGLFAVMTAAGILLSMTSLKGGVFCVAVILYLLCVLFAKYRTKRLDAEALTELVTAAAFGVYACYVIYTLSIIRQTDVGYWNNYSGHAGYTRHLYEHWFQLYQGDPRDIPQYYHAPLFYEVSAALIRLTTAFGVPFEEAAEVSQLVTLFSSLSILITSVKIFRFFKLRGYALTVAVTVVAMSNSLAMLAGSISNDVMAAALEIGAVYGALRWYESRKTAAMVQAALCFGAGMMTKISVWMAAPAMAFLFLFVLVKNYRAHQEVGKTWGQFGLFLGIAAPLSLWYPVRNLIRFGIPMGYVPPGGATLSVGEHSVWETLFTIGPSALTTPFTVTEHFHDEYNPLYSLLKSSVDLQRLGAYEKLRNLAWMTLVITILLALVTAAAAVCSLFVKKRAVNTELKVFLLIFLLTMMGSYVVFCLQYPYVCTENIRYVIPMIPLVGLYVGFAYKHDFKNKKVSALLRTVLSLAAGLYAAVFLLTFTLLAFD